MNQLVGHDGQLRDEPIPFCPPSQITVAGMPPVQSTLYTTAADIAGLMGASGLTLRLDDAIESSGGISGATNAAPIVITTPTAHGLATGDVVLIFGVAGNTAANGEFPIIVLSSTTFSLNGSVGNAAYTSSGAWLSTGTDATLTTPAINLATAKVNRFCQPLYDTEDLATSWSVWQWATAIASHWICARRNNPIPGSLNNMYLESLDELQAVAKRDFPIEDIGYRNNVAAVWSALRMDRRWGVGQLRVERPLSDRTPIKNYRQWTDIAATIRGDAEIRAL